MKTAVSIPDEIFEDAEALAQRLGSSRSALYAQALRELIARHDVDRVTERMNETLAHVGPEPTDFVAAAARRTLEDNEW